MASQADLRGAGTGVGGSSGDNPPVRAVYHVHTQFSYDSTAPLEAILERAASAGIRCLCVTDHDTIEGALALRDMAPPELEVVVGCEFTVDDGSHLVGLGLTRPIADRRLPALLDAIRDQGGLVLLPHPYRRSSGIFRAELRRPPDFVERVVAAIDIVECFNGADSAEHNERNLALAQRHGLAAVASSDAHTPDAVGSVFVEYADTGFVHGRSPRSIFFATQRGSREHPAKRRVLELYHARKDRLPGAVNTAYRLTKRALGRNVARRPAGPPELQYRMIAVPALEAPREA